jgi:lysophospholipid acyltransferase (LPLAT)-like uncharacterized protein
MSFGSSLLIFVSDAVARLLVHTLRFCIDDQAGVLGTSEPRLVWLFWHNRLLVVPHLLNRYLRERKGCALTSASKDGEVVARFLAKNHVHPIRGSSSRRGAIAMRELIRMIENGHDAAITPDGPRGPKYHMSPGPVMLAQRTSAKVLPIHIRYSRYWSLKSWDEFQIPKPFARVEVTLLPLESVAATESAEAFEQERARLEAVLRDPRTDFVPPIGSRERSTEELACRNR